MRSMLKVSLLLVILCTAAFADVAPDPGYTNVPADLILETNADLSGFRFFLQSPMSIEEITLRSGTPTVIPASGRGGAARYADLIAIPRQDLGQISGDLSPSSGLLDSMIRGKSFPNAREVLSHNFQATISVVEGSFWKAPVYRLSLTDGVIVAEKTSHSGASVMKFAIPVVIAGVLIAIGIAIIGIWLFRRSRKKV